MNKRGGSSKSENGSSGAQHVNLEERMQVHKIKV